MSIRQQILYDVDVAFFTRRPNPLLKKTKNRKRILGPSGLRSVTSKETLETLMYYTVFVYLRGGISQKRTRGGDSDRGTPT